MAQLTEDQKRQIVVGFAQCMSPSEIRRVMKDEHGLELELGHIVQFNPTKASFTASDRWRAIYDAAHKSFLEDVSNVPVSNQGYRLRMLQKHIEVQDKAGNSVLVAELLEQAAKEVGGLLTNARQLNVSDNRGGTMDLTPEERRAQAVELIREALAKQADLVAQEAGVTIDHKPQESVDK